LDSIWNRTGASIEPRQLIQETDAIDTSRAVVLSNLVH
jgi:hypothetical protein